MKKSLKKVPILDQFLSSFPIFIIRLYTTTGQLRLRHSHDLTVLGIRLCGVYESLLDQIKISIMMILCKNEIMVKK